MSITAGEVMDRAAALLNDPDKTAFTYTVQLPHLNIALAELNEEMQANNIPYTNEVDATIDLPTGGLTIGGGGSDPSLPLDLVDPRALYERDPNTTELFVLMQRVEYLPSVVTGPWLRYWTWTNNIIKFVGATVPRSLKLQYIANRISTISASATPINIINVESFLAYRTAALVAEFVGGNPTRSDSLNNDALLAIQRFLQLNTKSRQSIYTRRRPFMASYKSRGGSF